METDPLHPISRTSTHSSLHANITFMKCLPMYPVICHLLSPIEHAHVRSTRGSLSRVVSAPRISGAIVCYPQLSIPRCGLCTAYLLCRFAASSHLELPLPQLSQLRSQLIRGSLSRAVVSVTTYLHSLEYAPLCYLGLLLRRFLYLTYTSLRSSAPLYPNKPLSGCLASGRACATLLFRSKVR